MVAGSDDHAGTGSATYCSAVSLRQASRTLALAQRSYANNATKSSCMRNSPGAGTGAWQPCRIIDDRRQDLVRHSPRHGERGHKNRYTPTAISIAETIHRHLLDHPARRYSPAGPARHPWRIPSPRRAAAPSSNARLAWYLNPKCQTIQVAAPTVCPNVTAMLMMSDRVSGKSRMTPTKTPAHTT